MHHNQSRRRSAFTIVELIVVISVIAILAVIVTVSYGAWRKSVTVAQVKSDLNTAAATAEKNKTFESGYTAAALDGFTAGDGVTISLFEFTSTTFCIDGSAEDDIAYFVESRTKDQGPQEGTCATRPDLSPPAKPTITGLVTTSVSAMTLTWGTVSGAVTYLTQCSTDQGFVGNLIQNTITAPTVTVGLTGLVSNSTYHCRVRAVNDKGAGSWSTLASSSTSVTTPTGLAVVTDTTSTATYSWAAIAGVLNYDVQRATDAGFTANVVTKTHTSNSGTSTDLMSNTTYYFRVRATNSNGTSGWSTAVTAARTTITSGLLAWWPLNGDANDQSGASINGTINGPSVVTGQNGRTNGAYSFDGINDYIDFGEKYNSQALPISISMWVNRASTGDPMYFVWDDTSSVYYGINFYPSTDGSIGFLYMDGDGSGSADRRSFATDPYLVGTGVWHHVVITVSGATTATVYVDGVSQPITTTSGTGSTMAHTTSGPMRLGRMTRSGGGYAGGTFDDVRLYNRVLSADEAKTLYESDAW